MLLLQIKVFQLFDFLLKSRYYPYTNGCAKQLQYWDVSVSTKTAEKHRIRSAVFRYNEWWLIFYGSLCFDHFLTCNPHHLA
jgi:hypothetical protein